MDTQRRYGWLVSARSITRLIGAEYDLLQKCGSSSLNRFYIASIAILTILILSMCSIFYAMRLLFHMIHAEIVMAIFLSILFVLIYIFLLNTFSKRLFEENAKEGSVRRAFTINLSDTLRTGFVIFMAFMISKPLEVYIFQNKLQSRVDAYKHQLLESYKTGVQNLTKVDRQRIGASLAFYQQQEKNYPSPNNLVQIQKLNDGLKGIDSSEYQNIQTAHSIIEKSDFLLFRIQLVGKYVVSWIVCGLVIILFLLPGYLIYSISAGDAYYKMKRERELNLIDGDYLNFKACYTSIFQQKYGQARTYFTVFEDSPFNTKRKPEAEFHSQSEFLKKYTGE